MHALMALSFIAAAAASPSLLFGAPAAARVSAGGTPTFCFPETGSAHFRESDTQIETRKSETGPTTTTATRFIIEQFIDNDADKVRQDQMFNEGAFAPKLMFSSISDYKAGFGWQITYGSTTACQKFATTRPPPSSQCGAPDGVDYVGAGTQGPIETTLFRSFRDENGLNVTSTWVVAGDVPLIDSLLHYSHSFENSTFARYTRGEFEDFVRGRARAPRLRPPRNAHPLPQTTQNRLPVSPSVFVLPPECPK